MVTGCEGCGCGSDGILAELVEVNGTVERDFATRINEWEESAVGAEFTIGDGARAKTDSNAVLKLSEGSYAHLKANTQIRFLTSTPGTNSSGIDVETGEAELVIGSSDMELVTSVGNAMLQSGSRVTIRRIEAGLDFQVQIGSADFKTEGEETTVVTAGEKIQIGIGAAILTLPAEAPADEESPSQEEEPDATVGTENATVIIDVKGKGIRIRAPDDTRWTKLRPGSGNIADRTTLNLPKRTTVHVQRNDEKAILHGPGQFKIGKTGGSLIRTTKGRVSLKASDSSVTMAVPGGTITALGGEPDGTYAKVNVQANKTTVGVKTGNVEIKNSTGTSTLGAGKKKILPIAGGKQELTAGPEFASLKYADFSVSSGESFFVHTIRPPVAVEFQLGDKCPSEAVVKILGKKGGARGKATASLLFPGGHSKYTVRCVDENDIIGQPIVARGRVVVVRDSGRSRLPKRPPASMVDADGRRYKVFYQNQLPIISFRWSNPPEASSYALHIDSPGGNPRTISTKKSSHSFASGSFREGTHKLTFSTSGMPKRSSKTTTVTILFDNVAPKASWHSPLEGTFGSGETVSVEGVAVPGWKASLSNGTISMDSQHRFTAQVVYSNKYRAIALRLVNPKRGVHYYLRRGKQ